MTAKTGHLPQKVPIDTRNGVLAGAHCLKEFTFETEVDLSPIANPTCKTKAYASVGRRLTPVSDF